MVSFILHCLWSCCSWRRTKRATHFLYRVRSLLTVKQDHEDCWTSSCWCSCSVGIPALAVLRYLCHFSHTSTFKRNLITSRNRAFAKQWSRSSEARFGRQQCWCRTPRTCTYNELHTWGARLGRQQYWWWRCKMPHKIKLQRTTHYSGYLLDDNNIGDCTISGVRWQPTLSENTSDCWFTSDEAVLIHTFNLFLMQSPILTFQLTTHWSPTSRCQPKLLKRAT